MILHACRNLYRIIVSVSERYCERFKEFHDNKISQNAAVNRNCNQNFPILSIVYYFIINCCSSKKMLLYRVDHYELPQTQEVQFFQIGISILGCTFEIVTF